MSVEALCQVHDVFMDKERQCIQDEVGSSHVLENRNSEKEKVLAFKLTSNIKQHMNQLKVIEERMSDNQVDGTSVEVLCQLPDVFMDEKKQNMEEPSTLKVNSSSTQMNNAAVEDEIPKSHYTKTHWARETTNSSVRLGDIKEPVVTLTDHGSEINLISKEAYRRGKWPIDTDHGWKIQATTRSTDEIFASQRKTKVLDIPVTIVRL
jgi:hypothetical protein